MENEHREIIDYILNRRQLWVFVFVNKRQRDEKDKRSSQETGEDEKSMHEKREEKKLLNFQLRPHVDHVLQEGECNSSFQSQWVKATKWFTVHCPRQKLNWPHHCQDKRNNWVNLLENKAAIKFCSLGLCSFTIRRPVQKKHPHWDVMRYTNTKLCKLFVEHVVVLSYKPTNRKKNSRRAPTSNDLGCILTGRWSQMNLKVNL